MAIFCFFDGSLLALRSMTLVAAVAAAAVADNDDSTDMSAGDEEK